MQVDSCTPSSDEFALALRRQAGCFRENLFGKIETPDVTVVGETRTDTRHHKLSLLETQPVLALAESTNLIPPLVVFCVPPSGAKYYGATIARSV